MKFVYDVNVPQQRKRISDPSPVTTAAHRSATPPRCLEHKTTSPVKLGHHTAATEQEHFLTYTYLHDFTQINLYSPRMQNNS